MKARSRYARVMKTEYFMKFPEEIILHILYQLQITDIFNLQLVSHFYDETLKRIQVSNKDFWKNIAKLTCTESCLEGAVDCKQVLLIRANFKHIMKKDLEQSYGKYFIKPIELYFFDTHTDYYRIGNCYWEKQFSLTQMATYIIEDNAEKFFAAITFISEIAAILGQEYLSLKEIKKMIGKGLGDIKKINEVTFCIEELHFIAMLPLIMKSRAVRCFEIAIRAYFYLALYFDEKELEEYDLLAPKALMGLVYTANDDYFKKKLAHIVLCVVPATSPLLYNVLEYYHQKGDSKLVKSAMQGVDSKKLHMINGFLKKQEMNMLREALFSLSSADKSIIELRALLTLGDTYLKNNLEIKLQVLASLQKDINEAFDALHISLQEADLNPLALTK